MKTRSKTLVVALPYLKLWLANEHGFPMFKESSGIHNSGVPEKQITAVLREVAREICKSDKARLAELDSQISGLASDIDATDRSIREEADINRHVLAYSMPGVSQGGAPVSYAANMRAASQNIYNDKYTEEPAIEAIRAVLRKASVSGYDTAADDIYALTCYDPDQDVKNYASQKAKCLAKLGPDCLALPPLLLVFEWIAYMRLRRAKFEMHSAPVESLQSWRLLSVRQAWVRVTKICNLAIDWCKHLGVDSLAVEMDLKIRMHSYYGVALANLDRFYESHRHLNEASGINSKTETATPKLGVTKLRLRRAELLLTEAHRIACIIGELDAALVAAMDSGAEIPDLYGELAKRWILDVTTVDSAKSLSCEMTGGFVKVCIHPGVVTLVPRGKTTREQWISCLNDLCRLLTAFLDDAWVRLEYAEKTLSGQSQSNLWWGRLAVMKLRAFSYQATRLQSIPAGNGQSPIRMAAHASRRINPQVLWEVFTKSYLNNIRCQYRCLRLVRYITQAFRVCVASDDSVDFIASTMADLGRRFTETWPEDEDKSKGDLTGLPQIAKHAKAQLLSLSEDVMKHSVGSRVFVRTRNP